MTKDKLQKDRNLALVTGGTSGLGFAISQALIRNHDLALVYASNEEKANQAKEELVNKHPEAKVRLYQTRLSPGDKCAQLVQYVKGDFEKTPEILVNSAGRLRDELFLKQAQAERDELIFEHLLVPMELSSILIKEMYRSKFGRIINLSSITARRFKMGQVAYTTAKAGIEGFTKSLAREVAHRGVTVNAIAPGLFETPMTAELIEGMKAERGLLRKKIPAGYPGKPQDVGQLVSFLCSNEAAYITGQVIDICGGRSLVSD